MTDKAHVVVIPPAFTTGKPHKGHLLYLVKIDVIHRALRDTTQSELALGYDCHGTPIKCKIRSLNALSTTDDYTLARRFTVEAIKEFEKLIQTLKIDITHRWTTADLTYQIEVDRFFETCIHKELVYREYRTQEYCIYCEQYMSSSELSVKQQEKPLYIVNWLVEGRVYRALTTKPELLSKTVAVVCGSNNVLGTRASIPALGLNVPVIVDDTYFDKTHADLYPLSFVAYCGSLTDAVFINKHKLHFQNYIDLVNKTILDVPYTEYSSKVTELITTYLSQKIIQKADRKISKIVVHSERASCNRPIEYHYSEQYFIKIEPLKSALLTSLDKISITPVKYKKILHKWIINAHDWCISRTYGWASHMNLRQGGSLVDFNTIHELKPVSVYYDVWYDSAIAWLYTSKILNYTGVPHLQVQGYEILTTWAYYSMVAAAVLGYDAPFRHLKLTALLRTPDGAKYSKSVKNYESPLDLVHLYGLPAVRLWATLMNSDADQIDRIEDILYAKKVVIKLGNIIKFSGLYPPPLNFECSKTESIYKAIYVRFSAEYAKFKMGLNSYNYDLKPIIHYMFKEISTGYIQQYHQQRNEPQFKYYLAKIVIILRDVFDPVILTLN